MATQRELQVACLWGLQHVVVNTYSCLRKLDIPRLT